MVVALDLTREDPLPLSFHESTELTLFLYERTLEELGLSRGIITPAPIAAIDAKKLPEPDAPLQSWKHGDETWSSGQRSPAVRDFRYGAAGLESCLAAQGCFRDCVWCSDCEETCFDQSSCPRSCHAPPAPVRATNPERVDAPLAAFDGENCPPGWTASTGECLPPVFATCPSGQVLAGDFSCFSVEGDCSARFAQPSSAAARAIYVDASVANGVGTEISPYAALDDALAVALDGEAILLAAGTYTASFTVNRNVEIRGSCARDVKLAATANLHQLAISAPQVSLRDLTFEDGEIGILVHAGAGVRAEDVVVARARLHGILVESTGSFHGSRIYLHDGAFWAAVANDHAQLTLETSAIERYDGGGILAHGGATELELRAVRIDGVRRREHAVFGVQAHSAEVRLESLLIERSAEAGLVVAGSTVSISAMAIRNAPLGAGGLYLNRSSVQIENLFVEGASPYALHIAASVVTGSKIMSRAPVNISFDATVFANASTVTLSRVDLRDVTGVGVLLNGNDVVQLSDLTLSGTGTGFQGVALIDGDLTMTRARIRGFVSGVGVSAGDAKIAHLDVERMHQNASFPAEQATGVRAQGSRISIDHVRIHDVEGEGIAVHNASTATIGYAAIDFVTRNGVTNADSTVFLHRADIRDALDNGIFLIGNNARLRALDVTIFGGRASISVEKGAHLDLERAELREFAEVGISLDGDTTNRVPPFASLKHIQIEGSLDEDCDAPERLRPICLHAKSTESDLLTLEMSVFNLSNCSIGIWVDAFGEVLLSEGTVTKNAIGVQVRRAHDQPALFDTVVYPENCAPLRYVD